MNTVSLHNVTRPQSNQVCQYYLKGMCRFGGRCWNLHSEVTPTNKTVSSPPKNNAASPPKNSAGSNASSEASLPSTSSQGSPKSQTASPSRAALIKNITVSNQDEAEVAQIYLAQSKDKTCGICFEIVYEKQEVKEQVFGLLPNCNHCFCFTCIRKWRQSKEFEFSVVKACPECRAASDFVYPSKYWYEKKEEKNSFISAKKDQMQQRHCKYFRRGNGKCPFGNTCLYLHALPNGKKLDVGPPKPRRRRNLEHEVVHQFLFYLQDDEDFSIGDLSDDVDLDLSDPEIAMQFYEHDDIYRYIAMERLMNGGDTDSSDDEGDNYLYF